MRVRRSAIALSTIALLAAFTGVSGAAAHGVKGSPQPELKPFKIGASSSAGGSVAIDSAGALVVAYARGGRECSHTSTLAPPDGVSVNGEPQVFALPDNHVVALQGACCDANPVGDDVVYTSTDGGKTFGPAVRVGDLGVAAAALVGGDIVFGGGGHDGAQVESVPAAAPVAPETIATPSDEVAYDVALGAYKGGALVANEDVDSGGDYETSVEFAPGTTNFNSSLSYSHVDTFDHEGLVAMSGNALLTQKTTGKGDLELRLFNGVGFDPAHAVPGDADGGGPVHYAIDQDPSGTVHVFAELARDGYHLAESSTTSGKHWTKRHDEGTAIDNDYLNAGLDALGDGLVLGLNTAIGYPVLGSQSLSFHLKKASVKNGRKTTAKGVCSPVAAGRAVTLQREKSGRWYPVSTTHEKSKGSFTFSIKAKGKGAYRYRAVASDFAGYLEYGYSAPRTLHVRK
jgi:hypothetical protein